MACYNNRNKQQGASSYNRAHTIATKLRYKADLFHLHKRTIAVSYTHLTLPTICSV